MALAGLEGPLGAGATKVYLAHGIPVGTGGLVAGIRHWHAWIEALHPVEGWQVIDVSNGKRVMVPRSLFYRVGRLTEKLVWRYSPAVAGRLVKSVGTAGPWVPGWADMTDEPDRQEVGAD